MKNEILISSLRDLEMSEWWKYIKLQLEVELSRLTDEILAEWWLSHEGNDKKFTSYDIMRVERLGIKDFINKPWELISELSPADSVDNSDNV